MLKIVELFANEIKAGRKTIEDVPAKLQEEVNSLLNEAVE